MGHVSAGGEERGGEFDVTCDKLCEEEADIDGKKDINPRRPREAHCGGRGRGQEWFCGVSGRALTHQTGKELELRIWIRAKPATKSHAMHSILPSKVSKYNIFFIIYFHSYPSE